MLGCRAGIDRVEWTVGEQQLPNTAILGRKQADKNTLFTLDMAYDDDDDDTVVVTI